MIEMEPTEFREYYEHFKVIPTLKEDEEKSLLKRAQRGDQAAYEKFINSNIRLVMYRVLRFCSQADPRAMDLVSEGTLGLIKAVDQFDLSRNFRFSTYAVWWIDSFIRRAIRFFSKETITAQQTLSKKFDRARKVLFLAVGCQPTDEEVARYLNWPSYMLRMYRTYAEDGTTISHLKDPSATIKSGCQEPGYFASKRDMSDKIDEVLSKLSPEEAYIIRTHFGIGQEEGTYKDIASFFGLSKERIRQTENDALRKLFILLREPKK